MIACISHMIACRNHMTACRSHSPNRPWELSECSTVYQSQNSSHNPSDSIQGRAVCKCGQRHCDDEDGEEEDGNEGGRLSQKYAYRDKKLCRW